MRDPRIIALAALLAGCASQAEIPTQAAQAAVSIDREAAGRAVIADRVRLWKDPYSIRDASMGQPMACPTRGGLFPTGATCVCVELNAKNAMGGYTGIRRTVMIFQPGAPIDSSDGGTKGFEDVCYGLTPFPGLNGDYVPPKQSTPKKR